MLCIVIFFICFSERGARRKEEERERKRQTHTYTAQRNDTYEILITVIVLKYKGRWAS